MAKGSKSLVIKKQKVQVWVFAERVPTQEGKKTERRCLIFMTNEQRGGFWQPITGSVESFDVSLEAAAAREFLEETGIQSTSKMVPIGHSFEFTAGPGGPLIQETGFLTVLQQESVPILEPKEHQAFAWVEVSEALKRIKFDSNKVMLMTALDCVEPS